MERRRDYRHHPGHRGRLRQPAGRADRDPARGAGDARLHPGSRRCRPWPAPSTCRAPKCTASSPSTTTSAASRPAATSSRCAGPKPARRWAARRWCARAETRLGVACGEHQPDGSVTLEPVYCLGLCATGPSAMLDGRVVGRLTPQARCAADGGRRMTRSALFVPHDAAAVAVGADEVVARASAAATPRRATSRSCAPARRGMLWLEPLVEVEIAGVRHGFGPVEPRTSRAGGAGLLDGDRVALSAIRRRSAPSSRSIPRAGRRASRSRAAA